MRTLMLTALLALACCTTPPAPVPDPPPAPEPGPAATSCERACAHAVELRCTQDAALCTETCTRYEELGGQSAFNPRCMERAPDCETLELCRSGSP